MADLADDVRIERAAAFPDYFIRKCTNTTLLLFG